MLLTRDQARLLDHRASSEFGVPSIVLMENAGRGIAELLLSLGVSGPVVVCCGKGNNGGDGFVVARHLDNAGVGVRVLLFAESASLTGDAAVNHLILCRSGIPIETISLSGLDEHHLASSLAPADWIVDALFGSGLQGPVRTPFDRVIAAINARSVPVVAVDLPSGMDADTGLPLGACIRARHTATVVAPKVGFATPEAQEWLGEVHVVGMGAPRRLLASVGSTG